MPFYNVNFRTARWCFQLKTLGWMYTGMKWLSRPLLKIATWRYWFRISRYVYGGNRSFAPILEISFLFIRQQYAQYNYTYIIFVTGEDDIARFDSRWYSGFVIFTFLRKWTIPRRVWTLNWNLRHTNKSDLAKVAKKVYAKNFHKVIKWKNSIFSSLFHW